MPPTVVPAATKEDLLKQGTHSIYIGKYRDWETGSPIRNVIGNDIAVGVDGLGFGNGIGSEVRVNSIR